MTGKISFYMANTLVLGIICLFTSLVCLPLLQVSSGMYNQHWVACTASGVGADKLGNVMDASLQSMVRSQEQHGAELMFMNFINGVSMAVIAHGLALMALFGASIQEIASHNFGDDKDPSKAIATICTWFFTGVAYVAIFIFLLNFYPRLSGEGDGEWTKNPDFVIESGDLLGRESMVQRV